MTVPEERTTFSRGAGRTTMPLTDIGSAAAVAPGGGSLTFDPQAESIMEVTIIAAANALCPALPSITPPLFSFF
jgi:hypothetical protein